MMYESGAKKIWRVAYPILTHIVIYALVLFGAVILFGTLGYDTQAANEAMNRNAALLTTLALVITIPILYVFFRRDYPLRDKGFFKKPGNILLVILIGITASHGLSLLLSLFSTGQLAESYENVENAIYASSWGLVVLRGVILAPICEELLFRGLVFRRMKQYTNFPAAAIVSSVIFAVYHLNLIQGIFAFLFGLILCLAYERYQNLAACMILHATGNLLSLILTYTGFQYPSMTVYVISMIVFLLVTAWLCLFVLRGKTFRK